MLQTPELEPSMDSIGLNKPMLSMEGDTPEPKLVQGAGIQNKPMPLEKPVLYPTLPPHPGPPPPDCNTLGPSAPKHPANPKFSHIPSLPDAPRYPPHLEGCPATGQQPLPLQMMPGGGSRGSQPPACSQTLPSH